MLVIDRVRGACVNDLKNLNSFITRGQRRGQKLGKIKEITVTKVCLLVLKHCFTGETKKKDLVTVTY